MKLSCNEEQYEKFPEMRKEDIIKLLEWIKQQPHLPNLTEREVIVFFHACNYSVEFSKKTIDIHFTTRTHCPEFFSDLDINRKELQRVIKTVTIVPLKKSTKEGYKAIIGKLSDLDPLNFNYADTMKVYCMVFDLWLAEEGTANGHVIVMDMKGCTLGHVARLGLLTMKKFLYYLQEAAAIRLVGFHFINIVPFMDKILALMRPFMKKELMDIIQLHNSLETFYEYVPKNILPKDYGGLEPDTETLKNIVYDNLQANRDYFLNEEKTRRINEKLRPGKPKTASDIFGAEGNFKKLDID